MPSALARISAMAVERSAIRSTPSFVEARVCSMDPSARSAFEALSRVRVSSSCRRPEISCSVTAAELLPSASDWLPAETWAAAVETWMVTSSMSASAPISSRWVISIGVTSTRTGTSSSPLAIATAPARSAGIFRCCRSRSAPRIRETPVERWRAVQCAIAAQKSIMRGAPIQIRFRPAR